MSALTLADISYRPVITVAPDHPVRDVLETMRTRHISALAITRKEEPLGIFTEQDVLCLVYNHRDATTITAAEVMHKPPCTVPLDMDYWGAYPLFKKHSVHYLIVVDSIGRLTGIVSESDYLDHFGFEYSLRSKQVGSVLAHNVIILPEEATVGNAVQLMARQHLSCVVVERNAAAVGMLTESDLIYLTCDNIDLASTPLGDVVVNPVHSVSSNIPLDEAIVLMKESGTLHLVVEVKGNIVGLLNRKDIIALLYSYHIEYRQQNISCPTKESSRTHDLTPSQKAKHFGRSLRSCDQQHTESNIPEKIHLAKHQHKIVHKTNNVPRIAVIHCPLGYYDLNHVTTEQWQTESSRWEKECRCCELFDSMNEGVAVYQALGDAEDFIFKDHNHAGERIGGIPREKVIGKSVQEVFPGVVKVGLFEVFQRVWRTGKPEQYPVTLYRDECLTLWVENYVFKLPSGRIVVVSEDITQRKQAEEALRKSKTLFSTLARLSPVGIFRTDTEGRCTYANEKSAQIIGIDVDDCLVGQDWTKNLHIEDETRVREAWLQTVHTRQPFREEFRFEHADGGDIWVICQATPEVSRDGGVQGYIGTITDITTLKSTQAELEKAHDELEQRVLERTEELQAANRELESFTYSVSHDLKAPLRAITGFSQALIEDFGKLLKGEARLYLDQLIDSGNYMRDLIDGLLKISRSTRGELNRERLNLTAMASSIFRQLQEEEPDRIVITSIEPGMELVGDSRLIKVVMINLLSNAWKYTAKTERPTICVYMVKDGDEPLYCIEDNGAGFDMAYVDKLFAPFQRLHRQDEFPGIGIGLATVQRIIDRHGGRVQGIGTVGKGAKLCFTVGAT